MSGVKRNGVALLWCVFALMLPFCESKISKCSVGNLLFHGGDGELTTLACFVHQGVDAN